MKHFVIPVLALLALDASAAVRRLAECTTFVGTPSETKPFDLDSCPLNDGDEITQLLTDIRSAWPVGFFVRAPSKSLTLISDYIAWPTTTKVYMFLEDEDPENKLLIQHKPINPTTCVGQACGAFWTMWRFENFRVVRIGGPNLGVTIKGNHPGLANCTHHFRPALEIGWSSSSATICDINRGLVEFRMTDGSTATLADVRANFHYSQMASIYSQGGQNEHDSVNKINQFNVAGTHYATSGVNLLTGVANAWADPDRTVFSDPYVRTYGWDGSTSGTENGRPYGCADYDNDQIRIGSFAGHAMESLKGGFTIEYGIPNWVIRLTGRIGSSPSDPFLIRIKDWGLSGPGTAYPAGVRVRQTGEAILFKGDPADRYTGSGPVRFVRFEKLADTYASGPATGDQRTPGCAQFIGVDAPSNVMRFESDVPGRSTRDYWFELAGDWTSVAQGGRFSRGDLLQFGSSDDTSPNYGHTVRVAHDTFVRDTVTLRDRSTVTGPGKWKDLAIADASAAVPGRDSKIIDTNVEGSITVGADTENTTVINVGFAGSPRAIIKIGARASAIVGNLCAPVGSTITGTGSLIYDGVPRTLPFTITDLLSAGCNVDDVAKPGPPVDVTVQ